jgi:hypothetical protein
MPACPECGLASDEPCQSLFEQAIARDFSDYRYGRVHRTLVDCYALQHPDRYCASAKSLMAHLGGLCCAVERGGDPEAYRALQASLNGNPALGRPEVPAQRGAVTLADVLRAAGPEEHVQAVEAWAGSVWDAYAPLHPWARGWLTSHEAAP